MRINAITRTLLDRWTLKATRGGVGIGLVGVGGWGGVNAANIMRSRRFTVRGIHDSDAARARAFGVRFGVRYYAQSDALFDSKDIHAVCITVPNFLHKEFVKTAADFGKHVFIEKPLASSAADCRDLGRYCRERKLVLQVGHQKRREPVFRRLKQIVAKEVFGAPLFAAGIHTLDRRTRDDWRRDPVACPGGSMEQLGVHLIDVMQAFWGAPTEVAGRSRNIPWTSDAAEWGHLCLAFPGGLHATVFTSFTIPLNFRLDIHCENGSITTDGHAIYGRARYGNTLREHPKGCAGGIDQFIEFANCIERGGAPETGADEAAAIMQAVGAVNGLPKVMKAT